MFGMNAQGGGLATMGQNPQQQKYLIGGGLGDYFRNNSGALSTLAAGLIGGNRNTLANAVGQMPQAQAMDQQRADKAKQNAAIQQWLGSQNLGPEQAALYQAFPQLAAQQAFAGPDLTSGMKEYNLAKDQGFQGSYLDYQTALKRAGASNNTVNVGGKYGTIPSGFRLVEGSEGAFMEPVPGGPAAMEQQAAADAAQVSAQSQAEKASTILDNISGIRSEGENWNPAFVTGTASRPFAMYSDSPAGRIRARVGALQSGVALNSMLKLKEASSTGATGFGALSQKELDLLINDIGSLNPDNTSYDIFMETLDRIEKRFQRVAKDVQEQLSPEEIQRLGLEPIVGAAGGTGGGSGDKNGDGVIDWKDL